MVIGALVYEAYYILAHKITTIDLMSQNEIQGILRQKLKF